VLRPRQAGDASRQRQGPRQQKTASRLPQSKALPQGLSPSLAESKKELVDIDKRFFYAGSATARNGAAACCAMQCMWKIPV